MHRVKKAFYPYAKGSLFKLDISVQWMDFRARKFSEFTQISFVEKHLSQLPALTIFDVENVNA